MIAHEDDAGAVGARKSIDCHVAARSAEKKIKKLIAHLGVEGPGACYQAMKQHALA